jgi:carbon storage regulator
VLIIARRKGQKIYIGPEIEVVVTEISKSSVRIGIVAPEKLAIVRGEVQEAVALANREALDTDPDVKLLPAEARLAESDAAPSVGDLARRLVK